MPDVTKEEAVSGMRSPRTGTIEILQVLSLLSIPTAMLLYKAGHSIYATLAVMAFVVLAVVPFWLARPPQHVEWAQGFKITSERRASLKSVGVPDDILAAIDERLIGIYFPSREAMQQALNVALGEDRVEPWLNTLLLHSKYYGEWPPSPEKR